MPDRDKFMTGDGPAYEELQKAHDENEELKKKISRLERIQEEREESEKKYRYFFEKGLALNFITRPDGIILDVNERTGEMKFGSPIWGKASPRI